MGNIISDTIEKNIGKKYLATCNLSVAFTPVAFTLPFYIIQ